MITTTDKEETIKENLEQLFIKYAYMQALKNSKQPFETLPLKKQEEYLVNSELKIRLHYEIYGNLNNL